MSKHEISIRENTSERTAAKAPYLGHYIQKDTIDLEKLAEEMALESGLPAIQTRAIVEGEFEEMMALEKESLVRANFDGFAVCAAITGSLPTSDAPFDPERNKFVLAIRLDDSLRLALVNVTPAIVADVDMKRVEISEVSDIREPRPYGVIHGQRQFIIHGYNLVLTDAGAELYMTGKNGATYEVVVDEATDPQKIKAHTAELLEPGDYKVVVKSRGGDAEGGLQTRTRRVKYMRVVDPGPVPLAQTSDGKCKVMSFTDNGDETNFSYGNDWTLEGEGLYDIGAPEGEWAFDNATFHVAAEDLTYQGSFEWDGSSATLTPLPDQHITPGVYENVAFKYTVVRDGVTETLTLTIPTLTVS